jgi:hypothetical protein
MFMPTFGVFNEKDIDGRWFRFAHQQMGNSCTIASAKMAKEYYSNSVIGEDALRGIATLFESGGTHRGISPLDPRVAAARNWETTPGYKELTIKVLKAQPVPIPGARLVSATPDLLRRASRNHPALIGWSWDSGGGHCTVCVGATKADPDLVVILDPGYGLQYVNLDERVGNSFVYTPIHKSTGAIAARGKHTAVNTAIATA